MTEASEVCQTSPEAGSNAPSPDQNFVRRVLIVIGLVVLTAVILGFLWYGSDVILLIFAGFLLAIFLRSLSEILTKYTRLSDSWALCAGQIRRRILPIKNVGFDRITVVNRSLRHGIIGHLRRDVCRTHVASPETSAAIALSG